MYPIFWNEARAFLCAINAKLQASLNIDIADAKSILQEANNIVQSDWVKLAFEGWKCKK